MLQKQKKKMGASVRTQWAATHGAENMGKMLGIDVPIKGISFIHSHPEKGVGIVDELSNGDRVVGMLPGVSNMYRVDGNDDEIWRYRKKHCVHRASKATEGLSFLLLK